MSAKSSYRTKQQEELLQYLQATPGQHHTVLQIREYFFQKDRPIGISTIYRQLERFVDEGSVRKYVLESGDSACYEYIEKADLCASHFHCKCIKCGKLIHLDCEELEKTKSHLLQEHGFNLDPCRTVFYGTCSECREA